MMVFFYDSLRQRQSQSPATLLCGKTGTEYMLHILLPDSLTCIFYFNDGTMWSFHQTEGNPSASCTHRIYGILAEVFDHPFKEGGIHPDDNFMRRHFLHQLHLPRCSTVHIRYDMLQHLVQTSWYRLRQRTDLGESVGYQLKPLDILVHLRNQFIIGIIHTEDFNPGHQTGDWGTQLVSGFLRQSHPYIVLFRLFGNKQSKDSDDHKEQHDP